MQPLHRAHHLAGGVRDIELTRLLHGLGEEVAERGAVGGIAAVERLIADPADGRGRPEAQRVARVEEREGRIGCLRAVVLKRCQVVQDPERAPVSRDDEVVVTRIEREIVDRDIRQAEAEEIPFPAGVPRHIQAVFQTGVVEIRIVQIAPYHVRIDPGRQVAADRGPVRAIVARAKKVRLEVPAEMAIHGNEGAARIGSRDIDRFHPAPGGQLRQVRADAGPAATAITSHLHLPIVGAHPDHLGIGRGDGDREDGVVNLGTGVVFDDRAAGGALLRLIVAGEIRADRLPGAGRDPRS